MLTEAQFIKEFVDAIHAVQYSKIRNLASEQVLINWIRNELSPEGITHDDEWYAYSSGNKFSKEVGSRLSYLKYTDVHSQYYDVINKEGGTPFPMCVESINIGGERYYILTMLGQGACSWICTEEYFRCEFNVK